MGANGEVVGVVGMQEALSVLAVVSQTVTNEQELEVLFDREAIRQIKRNTDRLLEAADRLVEMSTMGLRLGVIEALRQGASRRALPPAPVVLEDLSSAAEDLRRRLASQAERNTANGELSGILTQFEQSLRSKDSKLCCSLARDIRCELVYLLARRAIAAYKSSFDRALKLLKDAVETFCGPYQDELSRHYAENVAIRYRALSELYGKAFPDADSPSEPGSVLPSQVASEILATLDRTVRRTQALRGGISEMALHMDSAMAELEQRLKTCGGLR